MSEWKKYRLSELTEPAKQIYSPEKEGNLPYVGLEHIEPETLRIISHGNSSDVISNKFRFMPNDILFGKLRPYFRKVVKPNFSGICSTDIWVFRAKAGFDQTFLFYFLANWDFVNVADGGDGGTRMPRADWEYLKNTIWLCPSLAEQRAIASILSNLDNKIDLLHRQNKTLEALAETVFRQWFVEEEEENWQTAPLSDFIETTYGGEWGKENPEGDYQMAVNCLRGTDIADLQVGLANRSPIRFIKQSKFERIEVRAGDLIMEISGGSDDQSTGRTTYINNDVMSLFEFPLTFSNFCRLIRPKNDRYTFFLYSYICHLYKQGDLYNLENGSSGIRNLNYKALLFEIKFKLPAISEVIKYGERVEYFFKKVNKNKNQIRTLTQLRDTLLPKLMCGEVRVIT